VYLSWSRWLAAVLLASTVVNFLVGKWLSRRTTGAVLSIGILFNLLLLGSFKYLPDIAISVPFSSLQWLAHMALPLGISFWTFQAMSYLFDVYRGEELDPTFVEFALYMVFFPIEISGPICRLTEMLPQFRSEETTARSEIAHGLGRIATGVFMMQVARLLGQGILSGGGIDAAFDHATSWTGADVWCLAAGYGLQLFLDFAGYSHIAIGAAQTMGITLPENFARPFESTSPSVFWTRWHMSLSFWIRDYIFFPLAVVRREMWWRNLVLVVSMILFGVWHKASVLFVCWGCYHGVLLVLHRQIQQAQRRFEWNPEGTIWNAVSWASTIGLVSLGWIFFRATSILQARRMWEAVLSPSSYVSPVHFLSTSLYILVGIVGVGYSLVLSAIRVLDPDGKDAGGPTGSSSWSPTEMFARTRWYWMPPLYLLALLLLLIVTHTKGTDPAQFMYRNF
jgi:D-alanyl-lipoteichoic acid acyltransferase DltB (MBOAT superfamily)